MSRPRLMSRLPRPRLLLGSCAAGLVVALAAAVWLPGRSAPPPRGEVSPSPPGAGPSETPAREQRDWRAGSWYRYALRGSYLVRFRSARPDSQPPPPLLFQFEGDWRVGVCSASQERAEVQVSLSPTRFSLEAAGQQTLAPEVHRNLLEALATPFFVTFDRAGAARLIHFERQVDLLTQGLLRSLVAATQVVLPPSPHASWEASEEDASGHYLARYQLQPALQLEKSKLHYTHLITDQGLQPVDASFRVQVHSRTQVTLAREDLWPRSLRGTETLEVDSGPDMLIPSSESQVELSLMERGTDGALTTAFHERQPSLLTLPIANPQPLEDMDPLVHERQLLAGRSLEDFIKALHSLPTEKRDRDQARAQALEGMHALFILEPAAARQIPALLRTRVPPALSSPFIGALSAASTPEAIQALCQIVGDSALEHEVRLDATGALGVVSAPTQEGLATLRELTRGTDVTLRETALLGLGTSAMNLREGDEHLAQSLIQELSTTLAEATTPAEKTIALMALGNTRAPSVLPTLQRHLSSRDAEVRAITTEALRFMPAPQADTLLSERLMTDESPDVRHAAVFAAGFRPFEPLLPAFQHVLQNDNSMAVRSSLIQVLSSQMNTSPAARRLLRWSSEHDPEEDIRRGATVLLLGATP